MVVLPQEDSLTVIYDLRLMIRDSWEASIAGLRRWVVGVGSWMFSSSHPASAFIALVILLAPALQAASVVVYTSQDQVFAEPIFRKFAKETGIEVKAVYDSEAVKTVGLVNRLMAEKTRPRCDLFWNNEQLRTVQLAQAGVLDTASITNFGHRQRQFVIRNGSVTNDALPYSLAALTNTAVRGKVALAYPLFGTTSSHFLALRERWGETKWEQWCRALAANQPLLVDGNSVVVKLVASGQALIGLTDSDDIRNGVSEGLKIMPMDLSHDDGLSIRNSAALVAGGPNPADARRLLSFLTSTNTLQQLVKANALDPLAVMEGGEDYCGCGSDDALIFAPWETIAEHQSENMETLKKIFLR
jgi:iron(III) transport system substrate-binding protein